MENKEVYYQIQFSRVGTDNWFIICSTRTYDSPDAARAKVETLIKTPNFDYRIIKCTLTEEVLNDTDA